MDLTTRKTQHGFRINQKSEIKEWSAHLYLCEHIKSGARLAFLDRPDTNKTFAIAFPTLPEDDTGVFHIIEHSVLCGSDKFPVKEPFVELLKSSLNTFLNALTYEDRTVYPLSSRCDRDYLNLIDVYLDAVFHPAMKHRPEIFLQEGHRYELGESGLEINGVVYSEMKGAYSSPDEISAIEAKRALFGGSTYGFDSGGTPSAIPSLTYEKFLGMHERYYHPSNAYIFLDGSVDLDSTLPLIDSYLSEYERRDIRLDFPTRAALGHTVRELEYSASESEAKEGLLRLCFTYPFSDFTDAVTDNALSLLSEVLAGTNESQIKKYILERGIADDVAMYISRTRVNTVTVDLFGVKPSDKDRAGETLRAAVLEAVENGIDRERLSATLSNLEFKLREGDYGSSPRGVYTALSVFGSWCYGFDPTPYLGYEEITEKLRAHIDDGFFESILREAILDNPSSVTVIMTPSATLDERAARRERERLDTLYASMSEDEKERIARDTEALALWQSTPDSPENLDTLPTLTLDDVPKDIETVPTVIKNIGDTELILHPVPLSGISYVKLYFEADMLSSDELFALSLLASLYKNLPTAKTSAAALQTKIKSVLGKLSFSAGALSDVRDPKGAKPILTASLSFLDSKREDALSLISEVLLLSDLSRTDIVKTVLTQIKTLAEEAFSGDPLGYALSRLHAADSTGDRIVEAMTGYDGYISAKKLLAEIDSTKTDVTALLSGIRHKVIEGARLRISVSGEHTDELAESLARLFPRRESFAPSRLLPLGRLSEGIPIPSPVSYATLGVRSDKARNMLGVLRTVKTILSYDYLWSEVRVKGGAYGTGFTVSKGGAVGFYSYRDPSPKGSIDAFLGAAAYLRALAESGEDLTDFIIGAFGEYDTLATPRLLCDRASANYLIGWTDEDERRLRADMLATSPRDLLSAAELLESLTGSFSRVIAASKTVLGDPALGIERTLSV